MKMKKKAATSAAKKPAAKKPAAKPSPKKVEAKKPAPAPAPARPEAPARRTGTYTPQPVQGIGWAPFRYPLQ